MIKQIVLLLSASFSLGALAQKTPDQLEKLKTDLSSNDSAVRQEASAKMWELGADAQPFLKTLSESDDPEVAMRAIQVLRKLEMGITPETPASVIAKVDRYFSGDRSDRMRTIISLVKDEYISVVLGLRRQETDEYLLEQIDELLVARQIQILPVLLEAGNIEGAQEILLLSGKFPDLIRYASISEAAGELDEQIAKLKGDQDQERLYLACLRVKGDAALLQKEARRLEDRSAEVLASLVLGDHIPLFDSYLEEPKLSNVNRTYLEWAKANHLGKRGEEKKLVAKMKGLLADANYEERGHVQSALFRMGQGGVVLASVNADPLDSFEDHVNHLLSMEDYEAAEALIGFGKGEDWKPWLEQQAAKVKKEIAKPRVVLAPELNRLLQATLFLEARGLREESKLGVFTLFDLTRKLLKSEAEKGRNDESSYVLIRLMGTLAYSAPRGFYAAVAREVEEFDLSLSEALVGLGEQQQGRFHSLYDRISELNEDSSVEENLLLTATFFSRRPYVSVEKYDKAFDALVSKIQKDAEEDEADLEEEIGRLLEIVQFRNRKADLQKLVDVLNEAGVPNVYFQAALALDSSELEKAAEFYEELELPEVVFPSLMYEKGLALTKGGLKGGEELMSMARLQSKGTTNEMFSFAYHHLRHGDFEKCYELQKKALLRSPDAHAYEQQGRGFGSVVEQLAVSATHLRKWDEALAYREVVASDGRYSDLSNSVWLSRMRFQLLIARGALAMESENDVVKAANCFIEAHGMLPRDGYLANDLFPVMREVGLSVLHDQLFAESARYFRRHIELYPKDDNIYNNFAWAASRANRCLDEAEEALKIGLSIYPESAAYLDTMGEIHFARGNREEAIKWSNRSLANECIGSSRSRWELQYQNRRFKAGPLPVK